MTKRCQLKIEFPTWNEMTEQQQQLCTTFINNSNLYILSGCDEDLAHYDYTANVITELSIQAKDPEDDDRFYFIRLSENTNAHRTCQFLRYADSIQSLGLISCNLQKVNTYLCRQKILSSCANWDNYENASIPDDLDVNELVELERLFPVTITCFVDNKESNNEYTPLVSINNFDCYAGSICYQVQKQKLNKTKSAQNQATTIRELYESTKQTNSRLIITLTNDEDEGFTWSQIKIPSLHIEKEQSYLYVETPQIKNIYALKEETIPELPVLYDEWYSEYPEYTKLKQQKNFNQFLESQFPLYDEINTSFRTVSFQDSTFLNTERFEENKNVSQLEILDSSLYRHYFDKSETDRKQGVFPVYCHELVKFDDRYKELIYDDYLEEYYINMPEEPYTNFVVETDYYENALRQNALIEVQGQLTIKLNPISKINLRFNNHRIQKVKIISPTSIEVFYKKYDYSYEDDTLYNYDDTEYSFVSTIYDLSVNKLSEYGIESYGWELSFCINGVDYEILKLKDYIENATFVKSEDNDLILVSETPNVSAIVIKNGENYVDGNLVSAHNPIDYSNYDLIVLYISPETRGGYYNDYRLETFNSSGSDANVELFKTKFRTMTGETLYTNEECTDVFVKDDNYYYDLVDFCRKEVEINKDYSVSPNNINYKPRSSYDIDYSNHESWNWSPMKYYFRNVNEINELNINSSSYYTFGCIGINSESKLVQLVDASGSNYMGVTKKFVFKRTRKN